MERLTIRDDRGDAYPLGDALSYQMIDKLCAYEDAEEQGLLVRLPCKVGDTVYRFEVGCCEYREKDACVVYCDGYDYACPDYKADRHLVVGHFSLNDIASLGKTIFLTREEAEAVYYNGISAGGNSMKIDELIVDLEEWATCKETVGEGYLAISLRKAAETIRSLWEIAQDSSNSKNRQQIEQPKYDPDEFFSAERSDGR